MLKPLEILFQDEHYVAVHKPESVFVHRSKLGGGGRPLLQRLRYQLGQKVFPVHRLDRPTSGLIIFGRHSEAAGKLATLFHDRLVSKTYLAMVRGWIESPQRIDYALDIEGVEREAVTDLFPLAKTTLPIAVSRYPTSRYALLAVQPQTGRRHQIRRHLKHTSHPIIGDRIYGDGPHNRMFREHFGMYRMMLHSWRLGFEHPYAGHRLELAAPPSKDVLDFWHKLGWEPHSWEGFSPPTEIAAQK